MAAITIFFTSFLDFIISYIVKRPQYKLQLSNNKGSSRIISKERQLAVPTEKFVVVNILKSVWS